LPPTPERWLNRLKLTAAAVLGLSLLNSFTVNLALRAEWTGADGTRYRHWTNGWSEGWYAQIPGGKRVAQERQSSPISNRSSRVGGYLPHEVAPRRGYTWSFGPARFTLLNARRGSPPY
jgi:hypothetical protein